MNHRGHGEAQRKKNRRRVPNIPHLDLAFWNSISPSVCSLCFMILGFARTLCVLCALCGSWSLDSPGSSVAFVVYSGFRECSLLIHRLHRLRRFPNRLPLRPQRGTDTRRRSQGDFGYLPSVGHLGLEFGWKLGPWTSGFRFDCAQDACHGHNSRVILSLQWTPSSESAVPSLVRDDSIA